MFLDREKTQYHFGNIQGDYNYIVSIEKDEFQNCYSTNYVDDEFLKSNFDIMKETQS